MTQIVLGLVIRHLLTAVGGYLLAKGYVDSDTASAISGSATTLTGIAWSIYQKVNSK